MMKRKLTQALILAIGFAGVGMLGSCKDYDEDKVYEITANGDKVNADLKDYVDKQDKALRDLIDALQKAQDNCKQNCEAKFTELNNLIVELQNKDAELKNLIDTKADKTVVEALQNQVNDIKTKVEKNIADIATLQTNVTTIQNDITLINQTLDNLKPRVEKNEQDIAALQGDVTTINNTLVTVQSDITTLQGDVTTIKGDITDIKTDITNLKNQITTINQTLAAYDTRITKAQKDASDALALAKSNETYIKNVEKALNDYKNVVDGKLTVIDGRLDNLETAVADLQDQINALAEASAKNFQTAIAIAKQLDAELKVEMLQEIADAIADYDANLQQQLTTIINNINTQINQVKQDYQNADADLQAQIDAIDAAYKAADAALKSELITKIAEAKQEVLDILNPQITDLQNKYTELVNKDTELQNQINDLQAQVDQNTADILANTQKINDLTGRVTDLENAINKMITGITVQGTYNPVYGTFALPTGLQSNVLMAFVGKTTEDVTFPTTQTGNYVYADQALTAAEATVIGSAMESYFKKGGKDLLSSTDDNAGTLYVTVNPNSVDFTGATLKLENSQAKSAGIELSPLAKSDKTLTFGYTRAADNGFYEAKAKINNLDQVQKIDIDKTKFKNIASELINKRTFNFNAFTNAVYDELNGFLDANAAVASWTDAYGDHSVYSNYNVAATAIHPLSYSFGKDFAGRTKLPGYDRIESFIDRIANRVNNVLTTQIGNIVDQVNAQWPEAPTLNHISLGDVTLADNNHDGIYDVVAEFVVNYTIVDDVEIDGYHYDIEREGNKLVYRSSNPDAPLNGQEFTNNTITLLAPTTTPGVYDEYNIAVTVKVDFAQDLNDVIDELLSKINGMIDDVEDVNKLVDALNDYLDDVNGLLDIANDLDSKVTNATGKITDIIKEYLQKFNDKGISFINAAIARMQPCLLVSTPSGAKMGINSKSNPTVVNSADVTLFPTSYTAEIVTPAFKKHVACVEALDKNGDQVMSEAARVNKLNKMNTVLDGAELSSVDLQLKSGYTYHFTYSALDYSGKICVKRAWVRVK